MSNGQARSFPRTRKADAKHAACKRASHGALGEARGGESCGAAAPVGPSARILWRTSGRLAARVSGCERGWVARSDRAGKGLCLAESSGFGHRREVRQFPPTRRPRARRVPPRPEARSAAPRAEQAAIAISPRRAAGRRARIAATSRVAGQKLTDRPAAVGVAARSPGGSVGG